MTEGRDRRRLALIGTPIWAVLVLGFIVMLGDRPLSFAGRTASDIGAPTGRAALVYRDRENAFFQWGTRIYTEPLLTPHYAKVVYITERQRSDRARVFEAAGALLRDYAEVDVFLAVHGERALRRGFKMLPHRERLRLVYSTGCADARYGAAWTALGADAFVGHDGRMSVSPLFYVYFLRRWIEGHPLAEAVQQANAQMKTRLWWGAWLVGGDALGEALVSQTTARIVGDAQQRIGR